MLVLTPPKYSELSWDQHMSSATQAVEQPMLFAQSSSHSNFSVLERLSLFTTLVFLILPIPFSTWTNRIQTDCGMLTFSDVDLKAKVRKDLDQDVDHIAFLPFGDLEQSVRDDVNFLKKSPLVLDVPITGYIYDVKSGKVTVKIR
jgi:hypothetical protein